MNDVAIPETKRIKHLSLHLRLKTRTKKAIENITAKSHVAKLQHCGQLSSEQLSVLREMPAVYMKNSNYPNTEMQGNVRKGLRNIQSTSPTDIQ